MYLKPTDGTDREDVEPRREENGEDERRTRTSPTEHKSEDGEHDGEERRCNGSQLGALAERCRDEERPTRQGETEQQVDDDDDSDISRCEYAEVPDDGDYDPRRKISQGYTDMPRAAWRESVC